jgi:hypothetical protein
MPLLCGHKFSRNPVDGFVTVNGDIFQQGCQQVVKYFGGIVDKTGAIHEIAIHDQEQIADLVASP